MATDKREKQSDLFAPRKKPPEKKQAVSKPLTKEHTEKKHTKSISEILAGAEGKNTGYEWEDYLRVCEYYSKHPKAEVPERPDTIGKGYYPMREIVVYSKRLKDK